jgi:hypothetical protein
VEKTDAGTGRGAARLRRKPKAQQSLESDGAMSLPPFSLPLPALLSQVLVAFTIEFDNEFELRVPHQTTTLKTGARGAPWLVSLAMWSNVLRFVDEDGVTVQELLIRTGLERPVLRMWLERLGKWWGYIVVEPPSGLEAPTASRAKPSSAEWIVRPSRNALAGAIRRTGDYPASRRIIRRGRAARRRGARVAAGTRVWPIRACARVE